MKNTKKAKAPKSVKPRCQLVGTDGNVFSIMAKVSKTLRDAGKPEQAVEFKKKVEACPSYDDVLILIHSYVDVA